MTYQRYNQPRLPVAECRSTRLWICLVCEPVEKIRHLQETRNLTSVISEDELYGLAMMSLTTSSHTYTTHGDNYRHSDNSHPKDFLDAALEHLRLLLGILVHHHRRRWGSMRMATGPICYGHGCAKRLYICTDQMSRKVQSIVGSPSLYKLPMFTPLWGNWSPQCRHNGNRIPVGRHHVIPTSLPRCLPKSGVPRGRVPILDVMV